MNLAHKCLLNFFCKTFQHTLVFEDASWPFFLSHIAELIVCAFSDNLSVGNSQFSSASSGEVSAAAADHSGGDLHRVRLPEQALPRPALRRPGGRLWGEPTAAIYQHQGKQQMAKCLIDAHEICNKICLHIRLCLIILRHDMWGMVGRQWWHDMLNEMCLAWLIW